MDKNKAIEIVYRKILSYKFDQDAVQYAFEHLLFKPDEFILDLHQNDKLFNYAFKIVHNLFNYSNSKLNIHKNKEELFEILPDIIDHNEIEEINLNNINDFDKEILILYSENDCNYSEVHRIKNISIDRVILAVNRARKKYIENEKIRHRIFKRQ